jgi:hypothetical protein
VSMLGRVAWEHQRGGNWLLLLTCVLLVMTGVLIWLTVVLVQGGH